MTAAPEGVPTPGAATQERWPRLSYRHPFRKYQRLALEAFDGRETGCRTFHVVAPPGSGKTVLGLEIARRLASPTLVLCPNTAIREQWRRQLGGFLTDGPTSRDDGTSSEPDLVSTDAARLAPLTVLTYQALCNLSDPGDLLAEAAADLWRGELRASGGLTDEEVAAEEARRRRERPRGFAREIASCERRLKRDLAQGKGEVHLLDLLHPNSRRLVDDLRSGGYRVVVLDECHHLFSLWGYVVRELVRHLGDDTLVVGLTSTPPSDLSGDEIELYSGLLGEPSFAVPTPAVVREGHLAPYQELAYFVAPLPIELEFVASRHVLFQELITRVLGPDFASKSLTEWVLDRVRFRESGPEATTGEGGARYSYARFSRQHPALARASVRFLHAGGQSLPSEVRLNEVLRQPPDIDDWIVLLEDYCLRCLGPSPDEADARALGQVKRALVGLGYVLTRAGVRAYVSPIDRVLALSAAKALAAADILRREHDALGEALRALVVCDYEQLGAPLGASLADVLDSQAGSAIRVLASLVADSFASQLSPVLVTGSGVYCGEATANRFAEWLAARSPRAGGGSEGQEMPLAWEPDPRVETSGTSERVGRLVGGGDWQTSRYLPLVTAFFEEGQSLCLVGTRSLLGEGWDAPRANTLVDLTTATTHTSMHQLRGRTLRIDPAWPAKVANNWDVVCVADLPKGASDYQRFVRKHRAYYGLTVDGVVESGTTHVHPALSPYAPPKEADLAALNAELIRRAADRGAAYSAWQIGVPYDNLEIPTIRVRSARPLGVGVARTRAVGGAAPEQLGARAGWGVVAAWGAVGVALALGAPAELALGAGSLLSAGLVGRFLAQLGGSFDRIPSYLALDGCARAVLEALQEGGLAPKELGFEAIQLVPRADGYYRCYLAGAPAEAGRLFAECLEDLLSPVENQRYLIPRYWAQPPTSRAGQAVFALRGALGRLGGYRVQYHPVPDYFAANRKRADVFARAWNRHVSPGQPIYASSKEAAALVAAERGRNAFGTLCQLRAIWQ